MSFGGTPVVARRWQHALRMLRDRGYDAPSTPYQVTGSKGETTVMYTHTITRQRMYLIFYPVKGKSISTIKENLIVLTNRLYEASRVEYFIVVTNATQGLHKPLQERLPYRLDVFEIGFFATIPVDHMFTPKVEATTLPQGIRASDLPGISHEDRLVRYYGWPLGQIVKSTRDPPPGRPLNVRHTYYLRQVRDISITSAPLTEEPDDDAEEAQDENIEDEVDEPVVIEEAADAPL